ncbi:XRE family transcriptional regulator [Stenotrophomonas maltophilia]|uniref:XRE family transcriptional regulator n=1 Tax=Stenotrophomonas maltophilia TaxID=40324 RepID=UPI0007EFB512|nr:S24 family peptidase [Stenotrophomonas maltophilia]OBU53827.1 cI repressor protein [Stenotrophomonas maltophilia]
MTMGTRLKEALALRGKQPPALIAGLGVSKGAVYNILNDTTKPDKVWADTVWRICQYLRIRPEWLIYGDGPMTSEASVVAANDDDYADVTGYSQAAGLGAGAEADEYAETHSLKFKKTSLRRRGIYNRPLAVYYGKGDSMEPTIEDGDAILFDTSDTRVVDGALYLIQVHGAANPEYYVKRAEILDGITFFRSDNPNGDHQWQKPRRMDSKREPITVVGRVHWIGGWAD